MSNEPTDDMDEVAMHFIQIKNEEIAELKDKLDRYTKASNAMINAGMNNHRADKEKNEARIRQLEERLEGMREAGDAIWYCVRHANRVDPAELQDAIEEWKEARNHA
jgi:23S rRNA pseudoU1915 N3-methylase RlmH